MITDRDAVLAEAATYEGRQPNFSSRGGALAVYLSEVGGELVVACEGTHNTFGWAVDFTAWPAGANDPIVHATHTGLPPMHRGFRDITLDVLADVRKAVAGRVYHIVGHSLGGGCGLGLAGYLADEGDPPASIFLFAPARVFAAPPDVLAAVPIKGWRCGGDIVPDVPPLYWRPLLNHFSGPADESSHHMANFVAFIQ